MKVNKKGKKVMVIGVTYNLKPEKTDESLPDDWYEEFDSLNTIKTIKGALDSLGFGVVDLGYSIENILKYKDNVDLVFNISEGIGGRSREGYIPSVLEYYGIKYVGSDPTALNISLDKNLTKAVARSVGVITPEWQIISKNSVSYQDIKKFPVIFKPCWEGSSKGIRNGNNICYTLSSLARSISEFRKVEKYDGDILIEEYIKGYDYTVGIVDDKVVGIMKIEPKSGTSDWIYSLESKRDYKNRVNYTLLTEKDNSNLFWELHDSALKVYHSLGCRDFSRVDFRVCDGVSYFIEINPLAGLNPVDSDLVIMTRLQGIEYLTLIDMIVKSALRRYDLKG
jgi:D-alanine-D-alanine ligase